MIVEDNDIKIYLDWTFICSSHSIEQALGILVGLYRLMNLKFHAYRTAARFFYVYFLNEKQQQSNSIRRFCNEYNIEIQDKPSVPINPLEEITNDDISNFDEPHESSNLDQPDDISSFDKPDDISNFDESDGCNLDLVVPSKKQTYESTHDKTHLSQSNAKTSNHRVNRKRKSDQFMNSTAIDQENAPPRKRMTRSTNRK
jgi:hypothetical protein